MTIIHILFCTIEIPKIESISGTEKIKLSGLYIMKRRINTDVESLKPMVKVQQPIC